MVETIEQLRELFPEITEEAIANRIEAKRAAEERANQFLEADRLVQSLSDQLRSAQEARAALDAQG